MEVYIFLEVERESAKILNMEKRLSFALSFDIHPLVEGRRFILGGVEIPFALGLLGHSDGDVLLHALTDAILSAGGFPDIGSLFPDQDPQYKNKESSFFVEKALELIHEKGLRVYQADLTVILDKPKIAPYYGEIKQKIAQILRISEESISLKARTTEGLIFQSERPGVIALALVVLEKF
ncbi:2-C-methyl-D-erythritol 2,4-cyclodiphosphate synthase [Caldimicrobium thiodismutans]|nr:2-C-methyl-D-erythritol 2,4-cyclodiphosphate synthase [Caldimicrobium thiodismutans]